MRPCDWCWILYAVSHEQAVPLAVQSPSPARLVAPENEKSLLFLISRKCPVA